MSQEIFYPAPTLTANADDQRRAVPFFPRPPIARNVTHQCRNIDRPAIAYGICPRLRTD